MNRMIEASRKRKRRPKVHPFHSFPEEAAVGMVGPFRDNIRVFLQQWAELESYTVLGGMPVWCTLLVHDTLLIPLYTIQRNLTTQEDDSISPFCDHCRCNGWSNHFVSKRKYHMIIPMDDDWNKPLDDDIFHLSTHLLHVLIHCNGFAHLLCINGQEGGSKHLCGRELMDLWDRICLCLQTRKITVEDTSKKLSMELRLLHGVAYGHPWFGRWGYKFCNGSFGIKEHIYNKALEILSSLELEKIIQDFSEMEEYEELKKIVCYYRYLCETQLITIRDLLRFMLTVKACFPATRNSLLPTPKLADVVEKEKSATRKSLKTKSPMKERSSKYRKFATIVSHMDSRWPAKRLEFSADVIVSALKEKKEQDF